MTKWEHYTTDERYNFSKRYIIEKVKAAQIRQVPDVDDLIQSTKEIYLPEKLVTMALLQSPQQEEEEMEEPPQLPAEGVTKKRYSSRTATIPGAARTRRLKVFPNDMYGPERYTAAVITGPSGDVEGTISLGDIVLINFKEGEEDTEGESLSSVLGTVYRITEAGISLLEHEEAGQGVPEFSVVKGVAPDSIVRTGKGKAFFSEAEGAECELERAKRFLCDEKGEPELWRWVSEGDELGAVARSELMAQLRRATRRRLRERRAAAAATAGAGKGRKRPRELRLPREPEKKKRFFPLMVVEGMTLATKPEKGQDGIIGEVNRLLERVATEERWDADMDGYDSSTGAPRNTNKKKARNGYRTIDSGSESDSWSEDDSDAESGKESRANKYSKKDKKDDKKDDAYKREDMKADKVEDKNEGNNAEGNEGNGGNGGNGGKDGKEEANDDTETETETDTETESESDTDTDTEGDSVAIKEGDDNENNENEDEEITEVKENNENENNKIEIEKNEENNEENINITISSANDDSKTLDENGIINNN